MSAPAGFVTRFVASAVLGTAAIVAVAPFVRPGTVPPWLEEPVRWLRAQPPLARTAAALAGALYWAPSTITPAPASSPRETPSTARAVPAPASAPAFPPHWGIVHSPRAPMYDLNGKFIRHLPAGTEVGIVGSRDSTGGRLAECIPGAASTGAGAVLLRVDSLDIYPGALDRISTDRIARFRQFAQLQAELETLMQQDNGGERRDNPHWDSYQAAKQTYDTYWKRVDEYKAKMEATSGDERLKWGDELRRLKGEDVRIGKAYEAARDAYKAWNAAHPRAVTTTSPQAAALKDQLARLGATLPDPVALP